MKEKNDLWNLDSYSLENVSSIGHNTVKRFWQENEEWIFKTCDLEECYLECFSSCVAQILHSKTVFSYPAIYHNEYGVVSKSYNPNQCNAIHLSTIISQYLNSKHLSNLENGFVSSLEEVWNALEFYYEKNPHKKQIVFSLMQDIVDAFLLQLFLGNSDLNMGNLIIIEENFPFLAPNFDYGNSFSCTEDILHNDSFLFTVSFTSELENVSLLNLVQSFVSFSLNGKELFQEKLENWKSFEFVLKFMEKERRVKLPEIYVNKFQENYDKQFKKLYDAWQIVTHNFTLYGENLKNNSGSFFSFEGKPYVFRVENFENISMLFFSLSVAFQYDLPILNCLKGNYQNQTGIFEEVFLQDKLSLRDVLSDFYNHKARYMSDYASVSEVDELYTLEDIFSALSYYGEVHSFSNEDVKKIMDQILEFFCLQIALGSEDFFLSKLSFFFKDHHMYLAPISLSGRIFQVDLQKNSGNYALVPSRNMKKFSPRDIVSSLSTDLLMNFPSLESVQINIMDSSLFKDRLFLKQYLNNYLAIDEIRKSLRNLTF